MNQHKIKFLDPHQFDGLIFDLDGVVTRTATIHAQSWKQMFDEYLQKREKRGEETYKPFDIQWDYPRYVDGKPRYEGVFSFLQARGIHLEQGSPDDKPDKETICGLGNLKNIYFHKLLKQGKVEVFEDAVKRIREWKNYGLKLAIVSSSKNCAEILDAAGLASLFQVRIDGREAERLQLPGKPAPDLFLRAAQQLSVAPQRSIVFEDAIAGVQAGRAGDFGLVVGVAREGETEALKQNGADVVINNLRELQFEGLPATDQSPDVTLHSALVHQEEIVRSLQKQTPALFLDYDGTLTPIVSHPDQARLSGSMRTVLQELSRNCILAIVSGRDLANVKQFVQLDKLYYAGSHGFDISGPEGMEMQQEEGKKCLPELDLAQQELQDRLRAIPRIFVERKKFAIAVHYRNVSDQYVAEIEQTVEEVQQKHPHLRKRGGKKIFELQPDVDWDKGKALLWLWNALKLDSSQKSPIYIGDDVTDEDAFRALKDWGIGIVVGFPDYSTHADYYLRNTKEVEEFLESLNGLCNRDQETINFRR